MRSEWHSHYLLLFFVSILIVSCSRGSPGDISGELTSLQERASQFTGLQIAGRLSLIPEFEHFAKKYWDTDEALVAQLWLLEQAAHQFDTAQYKPTARLGGKRRARLKVRRVDKLMRPIVQDYVDSPLLAEVTGLRGVFTLEQRQLYFSILIEDSPHLEVQAACLFALAEMEERSGTQEGVERAQDFLRRLIAEYSDVPWENRTYGDLATARLGSPKIGEPAMEITGVTWDDTPMKLSDFRGKVVVLDFWGDW